MAHIVTLTAAAEASFDNESLHDVRGLAASGFAARAGNPSSASSSRSDGCWVELLLISDPAHDLSEFTPSSEWPYGNDWRGDAGTKHAAYRTQIDREGA